MLINCGGFFRVLAAEDIGLARIRFQDDGAFGVIVGHAGIGPEFLVFKEARQQPPGAKAPGAGAGDVFIPKFGIRNFGIGDGGGAVVGYVHLYGGVQKLIFHGSL